MITQSKEDVVKQLDGIVEEWEEFLERSQYGDVSDLPDSDIIRLLTRARATIERASPSGSAYVQQAELIVSQRNLEECFVLQQLVGVVQALSLDIKSGYLKTVSELIHGELFGDFLEMAEALIDSGYKDPAAVIAGGTLEEHLRQMCVKAGVAISVEAGRSTRAKKADQMNADLAKSASLSMLDQKNVTAWLDLRNKAAHGHYGNYTSEQVSNIIAGIRDFITRNPA